MIKHLYFIWLVCVLLSLSLESKGQKTLGGFEGSVFDFSIHMNEDLVIFPADTAVVLWSISKEEIVRSYASIHNKPIRAVCFSKDCQMFASGGLDSLLIIWNIEDTQTTHLNKKIEGIILTMTFSENGKYVFVGGTSKDITVINVYTSEIEAKLVGHTDDVLDLEILDDNRIASTGADGLVIIWSADTFKKVTSWQAHKSWVRDIDYKSGLDYLLSVADDGRFKKWSMKPDSIGILLASESINSYWLTSSDIIKDGHYNFAGHSEKLHFETPYGNYDIKVGSKINKSKILIKDKLYYAVVATMTKGINYIKI